MEGEGESRDPIRDSKRPARPDDRRRTRPLPIDSGRREATRGIRKRRKSGSRAKDGNEAAVARPKRRAEAF